MNLIPRRECESFGLEDFPTGETLQWHGIRAGNPDWSITSRFVAFSQVSNFLSPLRFICLLLLLLHESRPSASRRIRARGRFSWPSTRAIVLRWWSCRRGRGSGGSFWWTRLSRRPSTSSLMIPLTQAPKLVASSPTFSRQTSTPCSATPPLSSSYAPTPEP